MRLALSILLLTCLAALADPVPSTNVIDWSVYAGVEGGIRYRTNIWTNLTAGASVTVINNALINAPSNTVVKLGAGTYNLGGLINLQPYKTLRGSGSNTLVVGSGGTWTGTVQTENNEGTHTRVALHSGYTKGSSNLVLETVATGLSVGWVVNVNETNDTSIISEVGNETDVPQEEHSPPGIGNPHDMQNGDRRRGQFVTVKAISNSTNLTIWPPLFSSYTEEHYPEIFYRDATSDGDNLWSYIGVEDLTLTNTDSDGHCAFLPFAGNSWMSNVTFHCQGTIFPSGLNMRANYRVTIQGCWFEHHGASSVGIYGTFPVGNMLVMDNIFNGPHHSWMYKGRGGGHAVLYNYSTRATNSGTQSFAEVMTHGGHSPFVLMEGNHMNRILFDSIHASTADHIVIFRNRLYGNSPWNSFGFGYIYIDESNWWNTVVGNVLGTTNERVWTNTKVFTWIKESRGDGTAGGSFSQDDVDWYATRWAMCGYHEWTSESNATSQGHSLTRWTSTLGANYEFVNASNHLDDLASDTNLANSYFFTSKPSWFGFLRWPPVDPWNPDYSASQTNIPAGYRYMFGTNPPSEPSISAPRNLRVISNMRAQNIRGM